MGATRREDEHTRPVTHDPQPMESVALSANEEDFGGSEETRY